MVSSSKPLGIGGEFVGDWLEADFWDSSIIGCVIADKAGTIHVQQGGDGANVDVDETFAIEANNGQGFYRPRVGRFWRIKYVNGGAAQGVFRVSAQTRGGR